MIQKSIKTVVLLKIGSSVEQMIRTRRSHHLSCILESDTEDEDEDNKDLKILAEPGNMVKPFICISVNMERQTTSKIR